MPYTLPGVYHFDMLHRCLCKLPAFLYKTVACIQACGRQLRMQIDPAFTGKPFQHYLYQRIADAPATTGFQHGDAFQLKAFIRLPVAACPCRLAIE